MAPFGRAQLAVLPTLSGGYLAANPGGGAGRRRNRARRLRLPMLDLLGRTAGG